jgi:Leucine-rich repeat (LRR) protein
VDLGHNRLAEVPEELGDLAELSDFLYLHDNQPEALPCRLERLKKLRYLNISENRFAIFPEVVCGMSGLVELRATDNQIAELPDSIGRLAGLWELHLRNNRLRSLPNGNGRVVGVAADRFAGKSDGEASGVPDGVAAAGEVGFAVGGYVAGAAVVG